MAGGGLGINDLGIFNIPEVSINEMFEQKQSIIMALNASQKLDKENKELIEKLHKLELKSNDRKSAVIVNSAAGVVVAIGTAFLTDAFIPSIATIGSGILLIAVGIWLTFKK